MRVRLLSLLPGIVLGVAFLGIAAAQDAPKQDKKPEAKKDDKKDDDCDEGCCGKDAAKVSAKQMECADCAKNEKGPCEKCETAVKSGAVSVIPIKGMMCASCENGVAKKLDGIDEVAKFLVSSSKEVAVVVVAPGKVLRLSQLEKALEGTKFSVDETAALHGQVTFALDCDGCPACPACPEGTKADDASKKTCEEACSKKLGDALGKIAGVEKVTPSICEKTKKPLFTLQLAKDSKVSIKQLKDAVAAEKVKVADFVMFGAKEDKKSSS
jgi:hypothetical protein